jgi:tRNA(fMet)-specific endonuclease VapC
MTRYMLDTNTVSHLIKGHPAVMRRVASATMSSLCLSTITQAELAFGLAKRPEATRLRRAVRELLLCVEVLPWDDAVAERYGIVRAALERRGRILAPLDLLIAAHALSAGAALVSNDRAFAQVDGLTLEDWTNADS